MRIRKPAAVINVSELPDVVFGPSDIMWWGQLGFIVIEGWALALCAAVFIYLRQNVAEWPPRGTQLPSLLIPTIQLVVMLLSLIGARWVMRVARTFDVARMRAALTVMTLVGFVITGLRVAELLVSLNVKWDTNAYGSAQWLVLGYHATLILLEAIEVAGMMLIFWIGPVEEKHFPDTSHTMMYWIFMVLAWVPLYVLCYLWPRWI